MLNILLVSHDLSVTGAPNSLLRQAKYLRGEGHNIEVWTLGSGKLKKRYIEAGFKPKVINKNISNVEKLYKKNKRKYDLVICNTILTYPVICVMQKYKIPTVWFIRETKLLDEYMVKNRVFAEIFSKFYNLYTVSEYAAKCIKKYNQNVKVIHNSVFDTCNQKADNITKSTVDFGFIGTLNSIKGVDLLVDAFCELNEKYSDINLHIAGGINNSEYLNKLLNKTKKYKNIFWLGKIQKQEKETFFDGIDVLCVPSLDDPCPLTVIEGAMHSKILITTENTGSNYVIEDGKSGYIVTTNSMSALKDAMEKVINSDIDEMKQNSRQIYLQRGTSEVERQKVVKMVEDTYNSDVKVMDNIDYLSLEVKKVQKHNNFIVFVSKLILNKELRRNFRAKYSK